jgi:hypothetical protein
VREQTTHQADQRRPQVATKSANAIASAQLAAVVYRGAIDNSPDGEKGAPAGGTLVNYIDAALASVRANRPVATAETAAYGCRVKYAD